MSVLELHQDMAAQLLASAAVTQHLFTLER